MALTHPKPPVLPSLESFLASEKLLSPARSVELLRYMADQELTAGSAVMKLKWVDAGALGRRLKEAFNIATVTSRDIAGVKMKKVLSQDKIKAWQVIPVGFVEESGDRSLLLGMTDPLNRAIVQSAETLGRATVIPAFLSWAEFSQICNQWFSE